MDLVTVTDLVPATTHRWQQGDAFLAGGTWLFSEPQPHLTRLLDLHAFGWPPLVRTAAGLEVAATCTLGELSRWPVPEAWPGGALLAQGVAALLGSFKICHVATVGGNIALSLPAGPVTAVTAALDGVAELHGPDGAVRHVPVVDLVTGPGRNLLAPGELLRSVHLPEQALAGRTVLRRASLAPHGRSAAMVIGRRSPGDAPLVVTVTAATRRPVQLRLDAAGTTEQALARLDAAVGPDDYHDDVHGAPAWRAAMTRRLLTQVLDELAPR